MKSNKEINHYKTMRKFYYETLDELALRNDYLEQQLSALVEYINHASKKPGWLVLHEIKENLSRKENK